VDEITTMKEAFDLFDTNQSGVIDSEELKACILSSAQPSGQTIYQMIDDIDACNSRDLQFDEFIDLVTLNISSNFSRDDMARVFRLFDQDKTGTITFKDLHKVARELGECLTAKELNDMIARADGDGDGEVSFEDFCNLFAAKDGPKL